MTNDRIATSYDSVAETYADRISDEMARKPIDRAWLGCLAELAEGGVIADVGCGPGHVAAYLAEQGARVVGIDLSPGMVAVAGQRHPAIDFQVGSLLALPVEDGAWTGAVSAYAIIHLQDHERPLAFAELARALAPEGWLLLSFHISNAEHAAGEVMHLDDWFELEVDLDFHFLSPQTVAGELRAAGYEVMAVTERRAWPHVEAPTQRCHILARRQAQSG